MVPFSLDCEHTGSAWSFLRLAPNQETGMKRIHSCIAQSSQISYNKDGHFIPIDTFFNFQPPSYIVSFTSLSSLNEFDFRALLVSVLLQYIDCDILSILNLAQPAAVEFQPKPSGLHKILLLVLAPVENPPLPHSPDPPSSTWVNFHDSLFCSVAKICILFSALLHWCPCLRCSLKPIMNC